MVSRVSVSDDKLDERAPIIGFALVPTPLSHHPMSSPSPLFDSNRSNSILDADGTGMAVATTHRDMHPALPVPLP